MKKWLVGVGVVAGMLMCVREAKADGNYIPVLVTSSMTNQGYLYPNSNPSTNGGNLLVGNGSVFNWTNSIVLTTTSATSQQFPALTNLTVAQLGQLAPSTTAQIVYCGNCVRSEMCVSSGTGTGAWVVMTETGTMSAISLTKCQ